MMILQLFPDEIDENLPSNIDIDIFWKGNRQSKPVESKFRIHILGIKRPFSLPVIIPQSHTSITSSTSSSIAEGMNTKEKHHNC